MREERRIYDASREREDRQEEREREREREREKKERKGKKHDACPLAMFTLRLDGQTTTATVVFIKRLNNQAKRIILYFYSFCMKAFVQ
jgi:hypothetical protein